MRKLLVFVAFSIMVVLGNTAFTKYCIPNEETAVKWLTIEEAIEKSKTEKRKVFIDVYTDWCGWCKVMDKNTFSDPDIAKYLNENYYPVKLDAEHKGDLVFKDHTFKYVASGNRGYHQLAAYLLNNKLSYPTVVFLDEALQMISPLPGYQKPDFFKKVMVFIKEDHYKTSTMQEWEEANGMQDAKAK